MSQKNEYTSPRKWGNFLLLMAFVLCFPLGFVLPQSISWENHLLEVGQNLTLLAGAVLAVRHALYFSGKPIAFLFGAATFFWIGFLGRELSWGAVLMSPTGMTQWGPSYSGYTLWWKPYMRFALLAMAVLAAYWFFAQRMWKTILVPMAQARALPVVAFLVFVLSMLTTINAEGHGFIYFQHWYGLQVMVLEELVESVGYVALLWMQYLVFRHWHSVSPRQAALSHHGAKHTQ